MTTTCLPRFCAVGSSFAASRKSTAFSSFSVSTPIAIPLCAPIARTIVSKPSSFRLSIYSISLLFTNFAPYAFAISTSFAIASLSIRKDGITLRTVPPKFASLSNTVTSAPPFARKAAQAIPAGPPPTMATFLPQHPSAFRPPNTLSYPPFAACSFVPRIATGSS